MDVAYSWIAATELTEAMRMIDHSTFLNRSKRVTRLSNNMMNIMLKIQRRKSCMVRPASCVYHIETRISGPIRNIGSKKLPKTILCRWYRNHRSSSAAVAVPTACSRLIPMEKRTGTKNTATTT